MKATEVIEKLKAKFPGQPEYIQAVSQVLGTIEE
jgi:glutamate dehydrogenase (NADP+)